MTDNKTTQVDNAPEFWERQPGESPQAFQAFVEYRDMGLKRSLHKVAEKLSKSDTLMKRWSGNWNWQARADAWDAYIDSFSCEELKKGITEMRERHVDIAKAMLEKARKALEEIPLDDMSPKEISTMVDVAAKLERISRGEATERTEGKQSVAGVISLNAIDLSQISDEELADLDAITGKIINQ